MGQGANALLTNLTRNAALPPPTLQPPPFVVIAQNARKRDTSAGTASITSARGATAGARGIRSPTAL